MKILSAIKGVLASLFGSKKFVALLMGVAIWLGSKIGLNLTEAQLLPILALIGTYIGAQGVADLGKSKAIVEAEAAKALSAAKR